MEEKKENIDLNISKRNMDIAILKGLCSMPEYIVKVVGRLDEKHFVDNNTKYLFKVLNNVYTKNRSSIVTTGKIRQTTMVENNPGLSSLLSEIDSFPDFDKDYLSDQTDKFIKMRSIQDAFIKSYGLMEDVNSYNEILNNFKEAIVSGMSRDLGLEYFNTLSERYERKKVSSIGNVASGFIDIDNLLLETNHAYAPGTLNVFNGESNIGKSIWLGQIAINCLGQGKKVVIITLEMSEDLYASRIDANLAKTKSDELVSKEEMVKERIKFFQSTYQGSGLYIKQMPTGTASAYDIYRYIYDLKMTGFNPDVVIVDYLNLMKPVANYKGDGTYTRVKYIAEEVRAMAIELNVVVWSATQLNRSGYSAVPNASHTSESMGTVHTADFMLGIYQNPGDKEQGIMNGVVIKNRYGPNNIFLRFHIQYATLTITTITNGSGSVHTPTQRDIEVAGNIAAGIPSLEEDSLDSNDISRFLAG